jgi:hypothetical protein
MLLALLGRESDLSVAELESLVGGDKLTLLSAQAVLLDVDTLPVPFTHLGGTIKLARLIDTVEDENWKSLARQLLDRLDFCQLFDCTHDRTFDLGISTYNLRVTPREITGLGLDLKKKFRRESAVHRVRIVPNKQSDLSSAQVLHNHLYDRAKGAELILLGAKGETYIAITESVQDIDAYSRRDFGRPCRDARVGMLPPKLAQIILNLAVGQIQSRKLQVKGRRSDSGPPSTFNFQPLAVLDPFCGTGVLIQEALLMGHVGHGADIDERIGECYRQNIDWLVAQYPRLSGASWQLADATTASWEDSEFGPAKDEVKRVPLRFDIVATEVYLGSPLEKVPTTEELAPLVHEIDILVKAFLGNVARQSAVGLRLCLAVPAWQTAPRHFHRLPVLDQISDLGYTWAQFSHVNTRELTYARDDQIVGRQLLVLERI